LPVRTPRRGFLAIQLFVSLTLLVGWLLLSLLRSETFWMYVNLVAQAWLGTPPVAPSD